MKDCEKFLKLISYSIDGKISKKEEEVLIKHLKECENCKKEREEMIKMSNDLKNIEMSLPEKAKIKLKKIKIEKPYKFNLFNYFPFLFSLIFFMLVYLLWQNLKEKPYPFCLEIKEKKEENFTKLINRIYLKKETPPDFFIEFEMEVKNDEKIFKLLKTNYKENEEYFKKELKKIEFENLKEEKYLIKIYKCP